MTTVQAEKVARRKLSLLQFAQEGGEESSVGPNLGEPGCQVITELVQLCTTLPVELCGASHIFLSVRP